MNRFRISLAAAMALALCACERNSRTPAQADTAGAAQEVEQAEQAMLAAFQAKDAARLTSHYTSDAVVALPGEAALKGNEAIGRANARDLADPNFKLTFANEKTEVASSGDLAYTIGTFNVTYTNPETKQPQDGAGNYITVFKKQADGSWKAAADFVVPGG